MLWSFLTSAAVLLTFMVSFVPGRATWANFCWLCAAGLSNPNPIKVYFLASYRPHLKSLLDKCNFGDPNLVIFCLCICLIKPFNWVFREQIETFVKLNAVKIFLIKSLLTWIFWPQNAENVRHVTLLIIVNPVVEMWPHLAAHPH